MEELETQPEGAPKEDATPAQPQTISIEEWIASSATGVEEAPQPVEIEDAQLMAVLEACVYVSEEPLMAAQIAAALNQDVARVRTLLEKLMAEFERPEHGVSIREVAGGYKMATKPEHHEAVRNFAKSLKAPLKLSLPALETLAVVAYKQPVTGPEIMDIRGVQGAGVLKTLLERKLITEAGRKNVIGKPILYRTTKEFLIQFGLKDVSELPTLKEFEEIRRMSMADDAPAEAVAPAAEADTAEASAAEFEATSEEAAVAELDAPAESEASAPPAELSAAEASAPEAETTSPEPLGAEPQEPAAESEAPATPVEAHAPKASAPEPESEPKPDAAQPGTRSDNA